MHGGGHIGHIAAHDCRRYRAIGGDGVVDADFDFVENIIEGSRQTVLILRGEIIFRFAGATLEVIFSSFGKFGAEANGKGFYYLVFINALAVAAFDIIGMAVPIFAAA